ncbi:hypothetical protein PspKH34_09910 [Parageobacillus sp. KH3-4]|nr:hypothetical protein Geoth_1139 [Parageobacillus thermoglucosidasius C56-YS93]BDG46430.1 hypothetical protein PspKH34_09910 [Parageobacillus sp. KH3-4]
MPLKKYNVHPTELYNLVKEYNHKNFILNEARKKGSTILIEHYSREVQRIKKHCYNKYGIILD